MDTAALGVKVQRYRFESEALDVRLSGFEAWVKSRRTDFWRLRARDEAIHG